MDFEGFVKFDFLISYVGMITVVMLLTNFTKNIFDKICYNSTKYVAYGFSFGLCTLAA